jgi:hypothetical protein
MRISKGILSGYAQSGSQEPLFLYVKSTGTDSRKIFFPARKVLLTDAFSC